MLSTMPRWFVCPYLNAEVELTDERAAHVAGKHREILEQSRDLLSETLSAPRRGET